MMQNSNNNNSVKRLYHYSRYIKPLFFFWDMVLLNIAYSLSFYFRWSDFSRFFRNDSLDILIISNLLWPLLAYLFQVYVFIRLEPIEKTLSKIAKVVFLFAVILFSFIVFLDFDDVSRLRIFYFIFSFFIEVFIFRIIFIQLLKKFRQAGYNYRNVVIMGVNDRANSIANILSKDLTYGYKVLGFFSNNENMSKIKTLGKLEDALPYIANNQVHEIYLSVTDINTKYTQTLIRYCEDNLIRIKFIPNFSSFTEARRIQVDFYENIPVVSMREEPLESTVNRVLKKLFDVCFSLSVIVFFLSWFLPIVAIVILIDSRGPVFFIQNRSGIDYNTFRIFKFRTMSVVESESQFVQATNNDPRITRVGRILRKLSIDELPQFFNVLFGSMSIVGPRPHPIKLNDEYRDLISKYMVRHLAKPGITGWAQVNGYRGETKNKEQMEKRVEYDIWYIENWSLLLDIKIAFNTVFNVLKGEENAG